MSYLPGSHALNNSWYKPSSLRKHKHGAFVTTEGPVITTPTINCVFCHGELEIHNSLRGNYIDGYFKKRIERLVNGVLEQFEIRLPIVKVGRVCVSCSPLLASKCVSCMKFYKHPQLCGKCGYNTTLAILPETETHNLTKSDGFNAVRNDMVENTPAVRDTTEKPIDPAWMTSRGKHRKF